MKKKLTQQEEFEIMKFVLDKFLWLGFFLMVFGIYKMGMNSFNAGISWLISGVIVLLLFLIMIVKEYEIIGWFLLK